MARRIAVDVVVAALAALALTVLFAEGLFFDLSLTVRTVLLVVLPLALFVGAAAYPWKEEFALAGSIAVLFAAGYAAMAYELSTDGIALLGFASFWLVIGLAYGIHERRLWLSPSAARFAFLGMLLISMALVGVDLQYGEVVYDVELRDEITVTVEDDSDPVGQQVVLGTATARTTFVFREPADFPVLHACVYTPERLDDRNTFYDDGSSPFLRSAPGLGTRTENVRIWLTGDEAAAVNGTLPVERADSCPEERAEPGVVVVLPGANWSTA